MRSTKVLLAFSTAACLFDLGIVLWAYFSPVRAPFPMPAAACPAVLCIVFSCVKEGSARFGLRERTPLFLKVLAAAVGLFAFFGMFLNLGTVRSDIFRDADGLYYYKGPEPRVEAAPEDVRRLKQAENRAFAGIDLMFTTFSTAYFAGVLKEEQEE